MALYNLISQDDYSVVFSKNGSLLRIQILEAGLLRITMTMSETFVLRDEPMVINSVSKSIAWELNEVENGYWLITPCLKVFLSQNGILHYEDKNGMLLTREPDIDGRLLRPIDIVRMSYEPDAPLVTVSSVDGLRQRAEGTPFVSRGGFQTRLSFVFSEDEAIYGLGQHEEGILNYRGQHQFLYQHNLKVACPVIMSSRGWGILYNSCSAMTFHDDAMGSYISSDADDEMDFFFMYGPEFDQMIAHIRHLTGDAVLLPKWSFGYIQSKERYCTQDELLSIAHEYRRRGIPLDALVQDWQTWPDGQWGQKSLDKKRYPNLPACIDELHDMGIKLIISIWPNMQGISPNRLEFEEKGLLLGNRATYDAFSDEARKIYWKQAEEGLFSKGVDGWWCDCTEPFEADWNGTVKMLPEDRMQFNVNEAKAYLDPSMINVYSLMHSKGIWEGQRASDDKKRVINLTRSGYPGQQRYGTVVWNGDISANWETLRRIIPEGLNFCLSGQPYWNFDIGGFFVKPWKQWFGRGEYENGCNDPAYRELYLRWFQLGAFMPMFRSHGTDTPREIWNFGSPGEEIYDALVSAISLRMQLLPYIYSLMGAAVLDHDTPMRMLAFDYRYDIKALQIKDQFMIGRNLMVCPILYPGAVSRDVYLPEGKDWLDFYTGERFNGGQTINVEAHLYRIPLFVPAGSIIPMGPERLFAEDKLDADITLKIYPGADGSFLLYDDAGDGYGYEHGEYMRFNINWDDEMHKLTIESLNDSYHHISLTRRFIVCFPNGSMLSGGCIHSLKGIKIIDVDRI